MQIDAEIAALHKKLQAPWSAWTALNRLTSNRVFIEEVIRHYDKFEKKTKMRILLSFIMLDASKRSECALSIIKLLDIASHDNSDQVRIEIILLLSTSK